MSIIPVSIEAPLFCHVVDLLQMSLGHLLGGTHLFAHCTAPSRGEPFNKAFIQNVRSTSLMVVACKSLVYFCNSCFLSKFSQYFHMALGCLLLVSNLITVLPLVMHSQCISCWRDTWTEFALVASMHNMMNLNVCKHIVPVLRLVWAFQTAPNTLAFF